MELATDPNEITVGEVILAIEGNTHLLECVASKGICVIEEGCRLKGVLAKAERIQMDYLRSVKLSDVVNPGGQLVELEPLSKLS